MHQNRASPFASDFYRRRGYRKEFRSEDHFYPFSSQKKSRLASDFLRRGNRKIAIFGGAVKIAAAAAENRAILVHSDANPSILLQWKSSGTSAAELHKVIGRGGKLKKDFWGTVYITGRKSEKLEKAIINSVQTRCIVKGEAQKIPLFWAIFWKFLIFSRAPVLYEFHKKTFKFNKKPIFTNTPCKPTFLYNAPSTHTVEMTVDFRNHPVQTV